MQSLLVESEAQEPRLFSLSCKGFCSPSGTAWSPLSLLLSYLSLSLSSTHLHSKMTGRPLIQHHSWTTFSMWTSLGWILRETLTQHRLQNDFCISQISTPGPINLDGRGDDVIYVIQKQAARLWWAPDRGWSAGGETTVGFSTIDFQTDNKETMIWGFPRLPHSVPFIAVHGWEDFPGYLHILPF